MSISNKIRQELIQMSDSKYKSFHSNLCPGINNILGIRVPVLREYAKKLIKKYSFEELINNIDDEYYEEIMLQGMLIGLNSKENFNVIKKYIEDYIPKIDNWAICDTFCAGLKIVNQNKENMWGFIKQYLDSDQEFYLRFAIVIILDYYIEEKYLEEIFRIFNNIQSEYYYVKMAIAWAISICLIKYYDKTINYLKNNSKIDKWTYNKSLQKAIESYRITKDQKELLKNMKKY
mgnify:FL=1